MVDVYIYQFIQQTLSEHGYAGYENPYLYRLRFQLEKQTYIQSIILWRGDGYH